VFLHGHKSATNADHTALECLDSACFANSNLDHWVMKSVAGFHIQYIISGVKTSIVSTDYMVSACGASYYIVTDCAKRYSYS
jgi:hypothetical protein